MIAMASIVKTKGIETNRVSSGHETKTAEVLVES